MLEIFQNSLEVIGTIPKFVLSKTTTKSTNKINKAQSMPEFTKTQKLTEREELMQRIREGRSSISEESKLDFLKQTGYSIGYLNNALYGKVTPSMRFIKQFNKIVKV